MRRVLRMKRLRCKVKHAAWLCCLVSFLYLIGVLSYLMETDYEYFSYPLDTDVMALVDSLHRGGSPHIKPYYLYNHTLTSDCADKCLHNQVSQFRVVIIVKSAVSHREKRRAIRKTWGFEKRFSDVEMRTVFVVGRAEHSGDQEALDVETAEHGDLVQASFIDSYYNNTLKTIASLTWAFKFCSNSKFYLLVDDDYYVSVKNLLKFVRNPLEYPGYLEAPVASIKDPPPGAGNRHLSQVLDLELPEDARLYTGHVFSNSRPQRWLWSKWYVTLDQYPYNRYPPYVTAGAVLLSKRALEDLYYAAFFTQPFKFDDIYLSILARKVDIAPLHCPQFCFHRPSDSSPEMYRHIVASHGFSDPQEMTHFWDQQKMAGNA